MPLGFRDGIPGLGLLCSAEDQHKEHSFLPWQEMPASLVTCRLYPSFPEPGEVGFSKQGREEEVTYLSKSEGSECPRTDLVTFAVSTRSGPVPLQN